MIHTPTFVLVAARGLGALAGCRNVPTTAQRPSDTPLEILALITDEGETAARTGAAAFDEGGDAPDGKPADGPSLESDVLPPVDIRAPRFTRRPRRVPTLSEAISGKRSSVNSYDIQGTRAGLISREFTGLRIQSRRNSPGFVSPRARMRQAPWPCVDASREGICRSPCARRG